MLDRKIAEAGNPFAVFLHERFVPNADGFVTAYDMWLALEGWCGVHDRPDVLKSVPKQHLLRHVQAVPSFEGTKKHRPRGPKGQIRGYLASGPVRRPRWTTRSEPLEIRLSRLRRLNQAAQPSHLSHYRELLYDFYFKRFKRLKRIKRLSI